MDRATMVNELTTAKNLAHQKSIELSEQVGLINQNMPLFAHLNEFAIMRAIRLTAEAQNALWQAWGAIQKMDQGNDAA